MRVFVLTTGRSGSLTFAHACKSITNHTSGHETRIRELDDRLIYPRDHIEVDNRLAWFLGSLDALYGDTPLYVHLRRDAESVARSYARRWHIRSGIMPAFASGIVMRRRLEREAMKSARLMVATVRNNIELFLRDKTNVLRVDLEEPHGAFDKMWHMIDAQGDLEYAHVQLDIRRNESRK